ncbi:hypothetical protein [Janthinobacterium sp. LB2P10]|uniref:hypothetical protein n=1 Tax=Janthinobacterium sp. LB2P10 TaxID=3424194 RepID=UPI003F28A8A9
MSASIINAISRFFRYYNEHCVSPNVDTLFSLLNSAHSLNDKLNSEMKINFFDLSEFVALKALRNFFHHEGELHSEIRMINCQEFQIFSDLMHLCLIRSEVAEKVIDGLDKRRRKIDENIIRNQFKWYGNVVDINPTLFNFSVHVFETVESLDLFIDDECYEEFSESYQMEEHQGFDHFIKGEIRCQIGNANTVLENLFSNVKNG